METLKRKRGRPPKDASLAIENNFINSHSTTAMNPQTVRTAVRIAKAVSRRSRGKAEDVILGRRMRYLRLDVLGFQTQQEFADALGLTRGAVGNWEQGKGVKRDSIDLICNKFGVSMQWLRTGQGDVLFQGPQSPRPPVGARMQLLPPGDYDLFAEQVETMLTVYLDHVKRRDGKSA